MTASIGSYVNVPEKDETTDHFISIADKNRYQEKSEGRNRIIVN